jgi:hypothetical protein
MKMFTVYDERSGHYSAKLDGVHVIEETELIHGIPITTHQRTQWLVGDPIDALGRFEHDENLNKALHELERWCELLDEEEKLRDDFTAMYHDLYHSIYKLSNSIQEKRQAVFEALLKYRDGE